MIDPSQFLNGGGGIAAAIVSVLLAGRVLVRRLARDSVEVAKDRAEVNILEMYKAETADLRTRLETSEKAKHEAISKSYELAAEITALRGQVDILKRELSIMHREVGELSRMLQELTGRDQNGRGESGGTTR